MAGRAPVLNAGAKLHQQGSDNRATKRYARWGDDCVITGAHQDCPGANEAANKAKTLRASVKVGARGQDLLDLEKVRREMRQNVRKGRVTIPLMPVTVPNANRRARVAAPRMAPPNSA